ncbi:serine/threonine-protein kinase 17B-like isoform X2 [Ornithodoros turicata]
MTNSHQQGFLSEANCPVKVTVRSDPITDHYIIEPRPFARGKFATVRRCVHKASGRDYAAKYIRKRRRASDVRHEILHEALVLSLCETCPRVVDLKEVFETTSEIVLILELASGGELQHVLDSEEFLPEATVVRLMNQILEAVRYLHQKNIAHLDIKPQNLLLTSAYPQGDILLCDFGISRVIGKGTEIREIVGTPDYVAPEILQYEPISLATDMWSLGVLAYVLLSGHSPFGGDTKQETFCNITNGSLDFPKYLFGQVSSAAKDFIKKLLVRESSKRLTVDECLTHPWLQQDNNPVVPPLEHVAEIPQPSSPLSTSSASSSDSCMESDCGEGSDTTGSPASNTETEAHSDRLFEEYPAIPPPLPKTPPPSLGIIHRDLSPRIMSRSPLLDSTNQNKQTSSIHINVTPRIRHQIVVDHHKVSSSTIERRTATVRQEVETVRMELDGLSINGKRLMFSDEILVDERVGVVY